jgi:hypothetical protein
MIDYRTDGPAEAQQIARGKRPCETAPNGTGARCLCGFDCANYWLRAKGYRGEVCPPATLYHVTIGPDGPRAAGPYASYDAAIGARSSMTRTWRMILRGQRYWVVPVEDKDHG